MNHVKNILGIIIHSIVDLAVSAVGLLVVPIALVFAKDNHLPKWAYWWDNMDYGIDGDGPWQTEHHPDDYQSFKARYIWLAIRNPAFNFGILNGIYGVVTSIEVHGTQTRVDNYIKYQGAAWREAWTEDGKYLAQYSLCKAYPDLWKKRYGLRIQMGPFIQAAKVGEFNKLGQSLLIQPFKEFKS